MRSERDCVIFDIDGTLSDPLHRLYLIDGEREDYDTFYDMAYADDVHWYVVRLYVAMRQQGYQGVLCTGRVDRIRSLTVKWLRNQALIDWDLLLMRSDGDYRPDYIIKLEMLDRIRSVYKLNPVFAVEDRPSVVKMWRNNGVPCLQTDDSSWNK